MQWRQYRPQQGQLQPANVLLVLACHGSSCNAPTACTLEISFWPGDHEGGGWLRWHMRAGRCIVLSAAAGYCRRVWQGAQAGGEGGGRVEAIRPKAAGEVKLAQTGGGHVLPARRAGMRIAVALAHGRDGIGGPSGAAKSAWGRLGLAARAQSSVAALADVTVAWPSGNLLRTPPNGRHDGALPSPVSRSVPGARHAVHRCSRPRLWLPRRLSLPALPLGPPLPPSAVPQHRRSIFLLRPLADTTSLML